MSVSVHEMLDYLDIHPVRNHEGDATTLLQMLYRLYAVYNTMPPIQSKDGEMCGEELAFAQGIMVGMHLMSELWILP